MSRRIEIELTSQRDEDTWTWRAAGAKEPRGTLDAALLPTDAKPGDLLRAEAEFDVDGIFIAEVLSPKARSGRPVDERLELIGGSRTEPPVTAQLRKQKRRKPERSRKGRKRDGKNGVSDPSDKSSRSEKARSGSRRNKGATRDKQKATKAPERPRAPRLRAKRTHRKAFIASLPAEQQVIGEQVMSGGLKAVRREVEAQNEQAQKEGGKQIDAAALLELSERLLAKLQVEEWRDRADAAIAGMETLDLRDLRAVLVAAEDFARDAAARDSAEKIRTGLAARLERSQSEWHSEIRREIADGRVVRALNLSSRPPKPGVPLPPDLAKDLTEHANAALGVGTTQKRLAVVLEAVAYSPVRPYVVLSSVPETPEPELLETVKKVASRIPEIAKALGVPAPDTARDVTSAVVPVAAESETPENSG